MSERSNQPHVDKSGDSIAQNEGSSSIAHRKSRKHTRGDSSKTEEHSETRSDGAPATGASTSTSSKAHDRKKVKKSKREASDKSKRSSGESGAESDASEPPSSPKEKKSADKRKMKKSDDSEKRRLKTRKSSKNKDKEAATTPVPQATTPTRVDSTPRDVADEDHESLAFDSSDEVTPLMSNAQDSDDGSLAMSTTNIRTFGQTNYMSSAPGSRVSYHSQISIMDGRNSDVDGGVLGDVQGGAPRVSSPTLTATSAQQHHRNASGRSRKEGQGSDDSEDDDGSVTWSSTAAAVDAQRRNKRASSGIYDGHSSAHSSDSESFKKRSYLKPRPATDRRPGTNSPIITSLGNPTSSNAPISIGPSFSPTVGKRSSGTFRAAASDDDRIKINVGGRIFETYVSTLRKYPHTLLGTMLHPRNSHMLNGKLSPDGKSSPDTELFFDRNPRMFEVILDFYRTSTINRPPDVTWEMLQEELAFFQIDLPEYTNLSKRVSVELRKLEYKDLILPASEYRKMMRVKLLKDHHTSIVRILDFIQRKIQRKADAGHNTSTITFYSPLHYTNSTPREIFKVISTNEVRELLIELLRSKDFQVKETNEYSKTKATSIIGLHDQIINYNDPQYFSFHIKW